MLFFRFLFCKRGRGDGIPFCVPGRAILILSAGWLQYPFPLHSCSLRTERHVVGRIQLSSRPWWGRDPILLKRIRREDAQVLDRPVFWLFLGTLRGSAQKARGAIGFGSYLMNVLVPFHVWLPFHTKIGMVFYRFQGFTFKGVLAGYFMSTWCDADNTFSNCVVFRMGMSHMYCSKTIVFGRQLTGLFNTLVRALPYGVVWVDNQSFRGFWSGKFCYA